MIRSSTFAVTLALSFLPPFVVPAAAQAPVIWANDGGDKVAREETRATTSPSSVINSVWDGSAITLFGARNEVIGANIVIEAPQDLQGMSLSLPELVGPGGSKLSSKPVAGNGVFDWTDRQIELFYIRYLQIQGLSLNAYEWYYDERHVPHRMRRPWTGQGKATDTSWTSRPDHDKFYPDIAIPHELVPQWNVSAGSNQSIWLDLYVPKSARSGLYQGNLEVRSGGTLVKSVPVRLTVRNITLPDLPSSKTMVAMNDRNVNKRFLDNRIIDPSAPEFPRSVAIRDRFFEVAHRHKLSLIDNNVEFTGDEPAPEWHRRLDGSLFTRANGYEGPGEGTGNNLYSVGTYGTWQTLWNGDDAQAMQLHTGNWERWFQANAPDTERFLYLADESRDYARTERLAQSSLLPPFATAQLPQVFSQTPSLGLIASTIYVGIPEEWESAYAQWKSNPSRRFYMYNGHRPASGSFVLEDDGVALRQLAWAQYKKGIDRWYVWESTYYNNDAFAQGETPLFDQARTFGVGDSVNPQIGKTGDHYSNGDGVLLYPGTDKVYPGQSYGVDGPFASLRLKLWRRGIQDIDYVTLASEIDPQRTRDIVNRMVPKVFWEVGVADPADPTWQLTDISWSTNPDDWESARRELASIIESAATPEPPLPPASEGPPAAPSSLRATAQPGVVHLQWRDLSNNEDGFAVQRARGDDDFSLLERIPAGSTSFDDTVSVTTRTRFRYRVRAFNAAGTSDFTDIVTVTAEPPEPGSPTPVPTATKPGSNPGTTNNPPPGTDAGNPQGTPVTVSGRVQLSRSVTKKERAKIAQALGVVLRTADGVSTSAQLDSRLTFTVSGDYSKLRTVSLQRVSRLPRRIGIKLSVRRPKPARCVAMRCTYR